MFARMLFKCRLFLLAAMTVALVGISDGRAQAKEPPKPASFETQAEATKGPYRRRWRRYHRPYYRNDYRYDWRYRGPYYNRYYNGGSVQVGPVRVRW